MFSSWCDPKAEDSKEKEFHIIERYDFSTNNCSFIRLKSLCTTPQSVQFKYENAEHTFRKHFYDWFIRHQFGRWGAITPGILAFTISAMYFVENWKSCISVKTKQALAH
jgi:hypothetical protein